MGCCADAACTGETCMTLPAGTTCGDCIHLYRCVTIFGRTAEDTSCEWFPRRYRPVVAVSKESGNA